MHSHLVHLETGQNHQPSSQQELLDHGPPRWSLLPSSSHPRTLPLLLFLLPTAIFAPSNHYRLAPQRWGIRRFTGGRVGCITPVVINNNNKYPMTHLDATTHPPPLPPPQRYHRIRHKPHYTSLHGETQLAVEAGGDEVEGRRGRGREERRISEDEQSKADREGERMISMEGGGGWELGIV